MIKKKQMKITPSNQLADTRNDTHTRINYHNKEKPYITT